MLAVADPKMQRTPNRVGKTGKRKFAAGSPDASESPTAAKDESPGESDKPSSAKKRRRSTSLTSLTSPSNLFKPGLTERQQMTILLQMTDPQKQTPGGSSVESSPRDTPTRSKVHKRNERGETPLHLACIKGDVQAVSVLIGQGADINAQDFAGWTPLHEACNHGHLPIVSLLLAENADVNAMGMDGDTPLHDAASNNHLSVVNLLLDHGANIRIVNDNGKSAVDVCGFQEVQNVLLAHLKETEGGENEGMFRQDEPNLCNVDGDPVEAEPDCSGPVTRLRNSTPVGPARRSRISPGRAHFSDNLSQGSHDLCKKTMKRRRLTSDLPILGGSGVEESEEIPLPVRRPRILSSESDGANDGLDKEELNAHKEEVLKLSFPISDKKAEEGVKEQNGCTVIEEETDPPKSDEKQENGFSDSLEEKELDGRTDSQSTGTEIDCPLPLEQAPSSPSWEREKQDHNTLTSTSPVNSSGLECERLVQEPAQSTHIPVSNLTKFPVKDEPGDVDVPASYAQSPSISCDQLSLVVTYPLELLKNIKTEKDVDPGVESVSADKGESLLHGEKPKPYQPVSTTIFAGNDETHTIFHQEKFSSQSNPSPPVSKPVIQFSSDDDNGKNEDEEEDEDSRSTIVSFSTSLPIVFSSRVQHPPTSSTDSLQGVMSPLSSLAHTEESTSTPTPPTLRPRNTPLSAKSGSQVYCGSAGSRKTSPLTSKDSITKEQVEVEEQPLPPKKRVVRAVFKSQVVEQRRSLSSRPVHSLLPHNHNSFLSSTRHYRSHDLPQPISAKTVYPPIPIAMQKLFAEQEAERIALLAAHRIEVDRLVLCFEQELIRVHQKAFPKYYPPLSVCTVLTEALVLPHPPQTHSHSNSIVFGAQHGDQSATEEDERERYERLLSGYVQDVWDKFHQQSIQLARRHRTEMETLWLSQMQIWRSRLREQDGAPLPCSYVPPSHVPVTHFGNFPTYAH